MEMALTHALEFTLDLLDFYFMRTEHSLYWPLDVDQAVGGDEFGFEVR